MDIQKRKIAFVQEFLNLQNEEVISLFEKIMHSGILNKSAKNKDLLPMGIDELNRRIDKSMEDSKNGKLTETSKLIAEIREWR